jgi:AcrR family transcriptional regulator
MTDPAPRFGKGSRSVGRITKGERTRRRLMDAAWEMLAKHGYQSMRIEDIADAAGVAKGTFYIYFENKASISMALMEEAISSGTQEMRDARTVDDAFLEILEPTVQYLQRTFAFADGWRALLQLCHIHPPAARLLTEANRNLVFAIERRMEQRIGPVDPAERTLVVYAMTWMVDGVLSSFIARDDEYLEEAFKSPEHLGELLSVLWYRAVYGEDPDPSKLEHGSSVLDFHLKK